MLFEGIMIKRIKLRFEEILEGNDLTGEAVLPNDNKHGKSTVACDSMTVAQGAVWLLPPSSHIWNVPGFVWQTGTQSLNILQSLLVVSHRRAFEAGLRFGA